MRRLVFAVAAVWALFGLAGPAQAQNVTAQNPGSVVRALQDAGYRAELTTDSTGDPLVKSSSSGSDFSIYFYGCTGNEDCRTIQFYAGYEDPSNASLSALNEWNKTKRFGRAYLGDDGIARLEMDVDIDDGGISKLLFEDNLEFWVLVMSQFEDHIGF